MCRRAVLSATCSGGEGLTRNQRKAKEQRQGSNRLRTAHGISGTIRIVPVLLESGWKGD